MCIRDRCWVCLVFAADIIYHLFDNFIKYREELRERKRQENERFAIFPCKLKILPNCVFNARNPIVLEYW